MPNPTNLSLEQRTLKLLIFFILYGFNKTKKRHGIQNAQFSPISKIAKKGQNSRVV
jgi:hypothetical protein